MYLLINFGGHRKWRYRLLYQFLHDYCKKAEFTISVRHIGGFSKSGIPIYNSEVSDTAGKKTRKKRRRSKAIGKRYAFQAITIKSSIKNKGKIRDKCKYKNKNWIITKID